MLIKKDKNEELERILANKKVDEQAKNLLQGILYKVEASYKDYKIVKAKKQTEEKYVREILNNIDKKCNTIKIVKLSQKIAKEEIQKELEKNKFYIGDEIVSYPIEEKILYAIEKKSRYPKILNNKYEESTIAISNLINTGKNMDRIEVLRDFNGWSWTTIKKEVENINSNIVYQTLQIALGEDFLDNWVQDKDGIIDYLEQFTEETTKKYGEEIAKKQKELLIKISIATETKVNNEFAQNVTETIMKLDKELKEYENTEEKIVYLSNEKKKMLQELKNIEKIIGQNSTLKSEYERINEVAPIDKKIFNIKSFKKQLNNKKQNLLEKIEKTNYLLNPTNYLKEKNKILAKQEFLKSASYNQEQIEELLIEFIDNFLRCFKILIRKTKEQEEIVELIYKFRYFKLLPFNMEKNIGDINKLSKNILDTEKKLVQKAIEKKVISNVPFEIMEHVFNTRIIKLEDLYYKISKKDEKYFVQIFDENISEEKFEIIPVEKMKINRKISIFI